MYFLDVGASEWLYQVQGFLMKSNKSLNDVVPLCHGKSGTLTLSEGMFSFHKFIFCQNLWTALNTPHITLSLSLAASLWENLYSVFCWEVQLDSCSCRVMSAFIPPTSVASLPTLLPSWWLYYVPDDWLFSQAWCVFIVSTTHLLVQHLAKHALAPNMSRLGADKKEKTSSIKASWFKSFSIDSWPACHK